jgi:hypothetical protein
MSDGNFHTGPTPWESLDFNGYGVDQPGLWAIQSEYEINRQSFLLKKWKDVMGRTFATRVGDESSSRSCARVMGVLKAEPAKVETLANRCQMDRSLVERVMGMLIRYELVKKVG